MENLLHKMEVALDFLPAGSYAAIDVTHSQKITNDHSPPDREGGRMTLSSTKDHKCTFRLIFPDRQDQCMPRTEDHKRAFPR